MLDVEKFEVLGMSNLKHWCSAEKAMRQFKLNEASWEWNCTVCTNTLLMQQLIIEGLLSESKYRGADNVVVVRKRQVVREVA